MKNNRKIIIQRLGSSFRDCTSIVNAPINAPADDEVVVRHHYAGVNGVYDQMMCLDKVEHTRVQPPADSGVEAAGIVEAVGSKVTSVKPLDPVVVVKAGKGYRIRQVCKAEDVIPVPSACPEVLALIPSGVSAKLALEKTGQLSTGEVVCISAAAGGLGNIAVQLAVMAGNHVIAICGNQRKADWLKSAGVDRVINYREESLREVMHHEYHDRLDLVLDSVGGETFDTLVDNLAPHGRLVVCGYTSDRLPTAKPAHERIYTRLYWKSASIRGFMNYRFAKYAPQARRKLIRLWQEGTLKPLVDNSQFEGLESVADAGEWLLAGKNLGKVIVDLRGEAD